MWKNCKECENSFEITDVDLKFYDKVSPVFGAKKYHIPSPTLCPYCREQRRLTFRNDRFYYSRNCGLCKKSVISLFSPEYTENVYCNGCWWSDRWDPLKYGRNFDFNRPFFEQFKELLDAVPKITMINDDGIQSINCEYTSDFALGKNAYMVLSSWHVEDCMFGFQTNWVKDSVDNLYLLRSQLMYECLVCENSYNCQHCQQVRGCSDCIFGYDMINCQNCLLSAGLRNNQYCIWNKQYGKEEYFRLKDSLNLGSWAVRKKLQKDFSNFLLTIPHKFANLIQCENTTGDNLRRCKDSHACFNTNDLHGCKFMTSGDKATDCYDCNSTGNPELCYESVTPDNGYMNIFVADCWNSKYLMYCNNCHNARHLFGCVGFKKNQYCVLNEQYSKEQYEKLLPKIIDHMQQTGEWGEFFSSMVAPFSYDETAAQEWYPLTGEEAKKLGYRLIGKKLGSFGKETVRWDEIPDNIADYDHNSDEIFACQICDKNYKINKQEFSYYKNHLIPLPRVCPHCRHLRRKGKLNPKKLWHRQCKQCQAQFETTFAPDRPEMIYCEGCYLKKI